MSDVLFLIYAAGQCLLCCVIQLKLELNPGPDRVCTITSPDVPGLVTEGSSPEEIFHNVQEALEVLLMGLKELGKARPKSSRAC